MFGLRTTRLLLRDLIDDDRPAIYALSQEPVVTRYQSCLRLASELEAQEWVRQAVYHNQLQPRQAYNLAIVQRESAQVIGWIGWGHPSDRRYGDYDFGYALLPVVWGKGYMTKALQAAIDYMFEALAAHVVYDECTSSNRASVQVMEKVGLVLSDRWPETDSATGQAETQERYVLERNKRGESNDQYHLLGSCCNRGQELKQSADETARPSSQNK